MADSTSVSEGLDGLFSDGRSSRVQAVRLHCEEGQWLVAIAAAGEVGRWPLARVSISPRLARTPRILRLPQGGQVEVADTPQLQSWFPQPPSRVEALADWLERRRGAIALSALLTVAGVVGFVQYGLPWAARSIAERLPQEVEVASSNQVVSVLERLAVTPSALPPARQSDLQAAFNTLVAGEPRAGQMRLLLVAAPKIGPNAFALPDGRIYLTDELVALAADDDELIAVMAHEAGHHVHRHGMRNAIENASVFVLAGLLLGDVSGSSLTVALPASLLGSRFSRGHEREADAYAFALLQRRGKSPEAFARIMTRLGQAAGETGTLAEEGVAGYWSSHPATGERIKAARQAAKAQD